MNKENIRYISLTFTFLAVAIIFATKSELSTAEFLIFLFSGILIGININKLKNIDKD